MAHAPSPAGTPRPSRAIGVDLGGTNLRVGAVSDEPRILHGSERPSDGDDGREVMDIVLGEVEAALERSPDAAAVGLGVPCRIDRERGFAIGAVNLPIADLPIRELAQERLDVPVFVDNDANVAALAEHRHGAGRGTRNMVMLTIGTGIGGGLILDGRMYRGTTGAGAELGHLVVDLDGPPCQGSCPNRGCLEAIASGTALAREAVAAAERRPDSALGAALAEHGTLTGRDVTDAASAGDEAARDVLALLGRRLGAGLSGLANVFEPEVIVVGGGATAAGDLLLEPLREELAARALPPMDATRVAAARFGPEAGVIGAATMALAELGEGT